MIIVLLTGVVFIAGLVLRFAAPALSLQQTLWQFRYGLLAWRLSLYAASLILGIWLYRRLPLAERPRLKRVAALALILLVVSEISNALQWGNGV
jgi:uncharacterized BrkB/YihY/UPF0761 family membrane protein